jgi:hydroxymethylbilane synthase
MKYKIGTRGSDLALWQANFVQEELKAYGVDTEIEIIQTQGDRISELSFDKMEGKGFFTKEIEHALLENRIDIAVHSHKDLETKEHEELIISAVSSRANPSEILIINQSAWDKNAVWELRPGSTIGTSSARRKSQILSLRPDLNLENLRGNVPTRIQKLRDGFYDAIVLAYAGVSRLNLDLSSFQSILLDPEEFVPAPAQGVLAIQTRKEDYPLNRVLEKLNNKEVQKQIHIERSILKNMDGGCQLPLGVYNDGEYIHVSFSEKEYEPSRYFRFRNNEDQNMIELIGRQLKTSSSV